MPTCQALQRLECANDRKGIGLDGFSNEREDLLVRDAQNQIKIVNVYVATMELIIQPTLNHFNKATDEIRYNAVYIKANI